MEQQGFVFDDHGKHEKASLTRRKNTIPPPERGFVRIICVMTEEGKAGLCKINVANYDGKIVAYWRNTGSDSKRSTMSLSPDITLTAVYGISSPAGVSRP